MELLTAMAIVVILAALLFPVFTSSREASYKTSCSVRLHQTLVANQLYVQEYDDLFMPNQYDPSGRGRYDTDKRWPQLLQPYTHDDEVFRCPADHSYIPPQGTFDPDLQQQSPLARGYAQAERANYGYNAFNLAPVTLTSAGWVSNPVPTTALLNPSQTLVFAETAWQFRNGLPEGGGSFVAAPPCRFDGLHRVLIGDVPPAIERSAGVDHIWDDPGSARVQPIPLMAGGVFGRHQGKLNAAYADGSVRFQSTPSLTRGCQLRPGWNGTIVDNDRYVWDTK